MPSREILYFNERDNFTKAPVFSIQHQKTTAAWQSEKALRADGRKLEGHFKFSLQGVPRG